MAAHIPPMLKYSIVHHFLNSPPVLIKFVSKFIVKFFKAQYALRLRSPLIMSATFCGLINQFFDAKTTVFV